MRKRVILIGLCALAIVAIGSSPRYLEELRIGGGYNEPVDGGADFDKAGNVSTNGGVVCSGVTAETGSVAAGKDSTVRGTVTVWDGSGSAAPGCLKLGSTNGTVSYVFVSNDRAGLRIGSALPTADTDGAWLTSGKFRGSGSTTDAVDLGTAEVSGTLPASSVGNGLTDAQVNNDLTISGGTINNSSVGATTASTGKFTSLQATTSLAVSGGSITAGADDATSGSLVLYGDSGTVGGAVTLYNGASSDTGVESWSMFPGPGGTLCFAGTGGTYNPGIVWVVNPTNGQFVCEYDAYIHGGDLEVGNLGTARGLISATSAGSAPGCMRLYSANSTAYYAFVSNDGAGLRIHTALPTSDSDGAWPAAGKFRGSGSSTDAVDLGTAEVAGTLPAANVGNGLTDAQVNDSLTISGGTVNNTPVGATTASTGRFTTLTATGAFALSSIGTFSANDTTPSVSGGNLFKVPNTWTAGNNITAFDDGAVGQAITVIGGDSDCAVVDGSHLKLAGNWTAAAAATLRVVFDGTDWYELSRSSN